MFNVIRGSFRVCFLERQKTDPGTLVTDMRGMSRAKKIDNIDSGKTPLKHCVSETVEDSVKQT